MILENIPLTPEFLPGAHNAIHTCLRLQPQERITLITDRETGSRTTIANRAAPHNEFSNRTNLPLISPVSTASCSEKIDHITDPATNSATR